MEQLTAPPGVSLRVNLEERGIERLSGGRQTMGTVGHRTGKMLEISSRLNGKSFSVDLDGVTFIDEHRKALLTEMDNTGVELTASGWRMCSFIPQIAAYRVNSGEHRRAWLRCRSW